MSRRSIMLSLDFLTSFLIFGFSMVSTRGFSIVLVAILMISLSIIQASYQPSVQASIPLLVSENQLMQANGIAVQINALATLLDLFWAAFCFPSCRFPVTEYFLNRLLSIRHPECIMYPFSSAATDDPCSPSYAVTVARACTFCGMIIRPLLHLLLLLAGLNLVLSSFITVGLPVI